MIKIPSDYEAKIENAEERFQNVIINTSTAYQQFYLAKDYSKIESKYQDSSINSEIDSIISDLYDTTIPLATAGQYFLSASTDLITTIESILSNIKTNLDDFKGEMDEDLFNALKNSSGISELSDELWNKLLNSEAFNSAQIQELQMDFNSKEDREYCYNILKTLYGEDNLPFSLEDALLMETTSFQQELKKVLGLGGKVFLSYLVYSKTVATYSVFSDSSVSTIIGASGSSLGDLIASLVGDGVGNFIKSWLDVKIPSTVNNTTSSADVAIDLNSKFSSVLNKYSVKNMAVNFGISILVTAAANTAMSMISGEDLEDPALWATNLSSAVVSVLATKTSTMIASSLITSEVIAPIVAAYAAYEVSKAARNQIRKLFYMDGDISKYKFRVFDEEEFLSKKYDSIEYLKIGENEYLPYEAIETLIGMGASGEYASLITYIEGGEDDYYLLSTYKNDPQIHLKYEIIKQYDKFNYPYTQNPEQFQDIMDPEIIIAIQTNMKAKYGQDFSYEEIEKVYLQLQEEKQNLNNISITSGEVQDFDDYMAKYNKRLFDEASSTIKGSENEALKRAILANKYEQAPEYNDRGLPTADYQSGYWINNGLSKNDYEATKNEIITGCYNAGYTNDEINQIISNLDSYYNGEITL